MLFMYYLVNPHNSLLRYVLFVDEKKPWQVKWTPHPHMARVSGKAGIWINLSEVDFCI